MIYLDNAATTQIDPVVLEAMWPYLATEYGNPGGLYGLGRSANAAVQTAREKVAQFIKASPEQVIFTSGGSEANNLVFHGTVAPHPDIIPRLVYYHPAQFFGCFHGCRRILIYTGAAVRLIHIKRILFLCLGKQ